MLVNNVKTIKSGKQRMSDHQKGLLVSYMQRHPYFAKTGLCPGSQDRQMAKKMWDRVTNLLNSGGPAQKSSSGWKQTWADMKSRVKLKAGEIQQAQRTGTEVPLQGSSGQAAHLNETEEAIYGLLGGTDWIGATENGMGTHFVSNLTDEQSPTSSLDLMDDEGAVHLPRVDFVSRLETNPVKINRFILPAYHNQTGDSKNQMPLTITYEQFHSQSTKESSSSSSRPPSAPARLMEPAKNGSFCFTSQSGQAQFFQLPPSTSSTHSPTLSPQMPSFNYVSSTPSYSKKHPVDDDQKSDNDDNDDSDFRKPTGKKKRKMTSVYQETTELYANECKEMRNATMLGIEALKSLKDSIELQTAAIKEMTHAIMGLSAAVTNGSLTHAPVGLS
ncbi:uncharacterized protein [Bemisia tabaci]|uniref:uncharacterized protein isoform X2 n=1 Tax=Bemisia tabaci TaxID=7038 RepID=UPI0008F98EA6|nr:PREDICTED: uncharacterized protein LOC109034430 isoform X2 [Bemisia tabaci]